MKHIILIFVIICSTVTTHAQSEHEKIKSALRRLSFVVGKWDIHAELTARSGKKTIEKGVYEIKWQLDSTYLLCEGLMKTEQGERKFLCYTTYDVRTAVYRHLYMYGKTAFLVTETGTLSDDNQIFQTAATLNFGSKTEFLRTELKMVDKNRLQYKSWMRYEDEKEDILDFVADMSRTK